MLLHVHILFVYSINSSSENKGFFIHENFRVNKWDDCQRGDYLVLKSNDLVLVLVVFLVCLKFNVWNNRSQ